jgi:Oxidoreductase family, NAD-binding Rossmann fold
VNPTPRELRKWPPSIATFAWSVLYEALLGDSSIDGVVIATPAETHYALAKEALRAGKDVFVEKPMTLQSTETEELTAMAEGFGRILMVGHLLEFHPAILRLQQLIEEGYLGRIEYIYSNRLNLGKVRREENALWSFAPHDISVILFLLNELPMQVTATGGTLITDNAGIDLNPATGTIQFTYAGIAQFNITGMNTASLSPTAVMSATLNGVLTSAVSFTVAISDNGFHIPNPPVFIAQDVGGTSCHADCGNGVTGTLAAQGFFGANNVNFNTGGTSTGVATTTLNEGTQSARSGTIFSGSPYSLTEFVTVTLTPGTTTNEFAQINADLRVPQFRNKSNPSVFETFRSCAAPCFGS